jgi:hypothetical protein
MVRYEKKNNPHAGRKGQSFQGQGESGRTEERRHAGSALLHGIVANCFANMKTGRY